MTFPFLFAVMFGDIGHGFMLMMFGLYMVFKGYKSSELILPLVPMRYMIFMCGLFAIYCGFIYNDFMSVPLEFFGKSCYYSGKNDKGEVDVLRIEDCVYPFGIDPKWFGSKNELNYFNSLKMKLSVIFGVAQMTLGVLLKGSNSIFFKRGADFIHEFVPQLILLICLFGYMDLLIVIKWLTDYSGDESNAPSIITTMIDIALNGAKITGRPFIVSDTLNSFISIVLFSKNLLY